MTSNFPLHFGGVFRLPFIFGSWSPTCWGYPRTDTRRVRPDAARCGTPAPVLAKPRRWQHGLNITSTWHHLQSLTPRRPGLGAFQTRQVRVKHWSSLPRTGRARATKSATRGLPYHIFRSTSIYLRWLFDLPSAAFGHRIIQFLVHTASHAFFCFFMLGFNSTVICTN